MKDELLEAAYLAGFNASGEGYNGEFPFDDRDQKPQHDPAWCKDRDNAIAAIKQARSAPVQPVAWLIPGSITTDFELAKANGDKAVPLGEISKQQWNPKDHYEDGWRDALESVKRATPPAAPVQRCALCNYQHGHTIGCKNNPVDIALAKAAQPAPVQEPAIKQGWDVDTLLDKPAAQRPVAEPHKWVGLTDEEINACDPQEECWGLYEAVRRAEAKLRSKNNG
jgi:hypothetical protein